MPHDNKGRRIAVGDFIKATPLNHSRTPIVGRVAELKEGQTCSGQLVWAGIGESHKDYFDAESCELVLKSDGSEPPDPES